MGVYVRNRHQLPAYQRAKINEEHLPSGHTLRIPISDRRHAWATPCPFPALRVPAAHTPSSHQPEASSTLPTSQQPSTKNSCPQRIIETCDEDDHGDVGGVGLTKDDGGVRRDHDGGDDHVHQRRRPPCARRSVIGAPSRLAPVHRAYAGAYQN